MMKTIVFYSFKGGTGRSLALAQLAMLLKEHQKKVFVLDFDLGAPGLWEKLARPLKMEERLTPHFGVVEYLSKHQNRKNLETLDHKVITADGLSLLVAGDAFGKDDDYWTTYFKPDFQAFLALSAASDELIKRIKEKIAADYNPAYLLIDAPSGVSRLAAMAIQLLADEVVFLSAYHREGLLGTNFHLRKIQEEKTKRRPVPKPHCVLTRVPVHYSRGAGIQTTTQDELELIREDALRTINFDLREDHRVTKLHTFTAEPLLELRESLPMSDDRMETSPLVQDYITFFSALIPELEEPLALLRKATKRPRTFMLIEDQGRMLNPADDSPNVALRVDTLVNTFMSIVDTVSGNSGMEAARAVLFRAGWTAGSQFSRYLLEHWEVSEGTRRTNLTVPEKLTEWCEFDSTVGFGKFGHKLWGTGEEGLIELENSFLVTGRPADGPNLCSFMTGYVTQVLAAVFPSTEVKVTHDDEDCGQYKEDDQTCVFRFTTVVPRTPNPVAAPRSATKRRTQ